MTTTSIEPRIREALRKQGAKAADLTDSQRERAATITTARPDLKGKAAADWILTEPEPLNAPQSTNGGNGRSERDPEAVDVAARAKAFAGTKSRFWTNEARTFLDEFQVDLGDPTTVTVLRSGRNAVLPRRDVVDYACGEMPRKDRKVVEAELAKVNGDGAVHWDRALAAMIAVLFEAEAS